MLERIVREHKPRSLGGAKVRSGIQQNLNAPGGSRVHNVTGIKILLSGEKLGLRFASMLDGHPPKHRIHTASLSGNHKLLAVLSAGYHRGAEH